ncbi:MAG: host attachment protein [Alphaproteobacteria bacterium]|nr:host attachment protein [Alphaproteobacteria bacterium]
MAARQKPTWIAVLDGTQARFFALRKMDDRQIFEQTAEALSAGQSGLMRVQRGDRPVRASSVDKARGAAEPRHDYRKLDKHDFIREVAGALDAAFTDRRYGQLVLVAPPRSLGKLRELLSDRVRSSLAHEMPKNLTKLGTEALWTKLSAHLLKAATPLSSTDSRVSEKKANGGHLPVSVIFRNMASSLSVEASALRHADKLGRKFGRIVSCRVVVEAPHRHHRKGRLFQVNVDLVVPGCEITTKGAGSSKHASEDVNIALRGAFGAAARQLKDYVTRRSSGAQKRRLSSQYERRLGKEL